MAEKRVKVTLKGKDLATSAINSVGRSLKRLKEVVFSVQGAMVALAAVAIGKMTITLLKAFSKQEDAVISLRASLIATGKDGADALEKITKEAARLQQVTRAADEELIGAVATFAQLAPALNADSLVKSQRAILAIADTFLKGDVQNAALLLGKSIGSTTNALTRYGIQIDTTASQNDKLNSVLSQTEGFFAVTEARAGSLSGKVQQLKNAWGDLQETLGGFLAQQPMVNAFLNESKKLIENMTIIFKAGGPVIKDAFAELGTIAANSFSVAVITGLDIIPGKMLSFLDGIRDEAIANIQGSLLNLDEIARAAATGQRVGAGNAGGSGGGAEPIDPRTGVVLGRRRGVTGGIHPIAPRGLFQFGGGAAGGGPRGGLPNFAELISMSRELDGEFASLSGHMRSVARAHEEVGQASANAAAVAINAWAGVVSGIIRSAQGGFSLSGILGTAGGIASLIPGGQIIGGALLAGAAVTGALSAGGGPTPVTISSFSPQAQSQLSQNSGPENLTVRIINPVTGETLDEIRYELDRLTRRDAVARIPRNLRGHRIG